MEWKRNAARAGWAGPEREDRGRAYRRLLREVLRLRRCNALLERMEDEASEQIDRMDRRLRSLDALNGCLSRALGERAEELRRSAEAEAAQEEADTPPLPARFLHRGPVSAEAFCAMCEGISEALSDALGGYPAAAFAAWPRAAQRRAAEALLSVRALAEQLDGALRHGA